MCFFSLFLISCKTKCVNRHSSQGLPSTTADVRCLKIQDKAKKEGIRTKVCYNGPLIRGADPGAIDPNPEACNALINKADKECDALPYDPDSIVQTSGSSFYKRLPDCDECKNCEPISNP